MSRGPQSSRDVLVLSQFLFCCLLYRTLGLLTKLFYTIVAITVYLKVSLRTVIDLGETAVIQLLKYENAFNCSNNQKYPSQLKK